MSQNEEQRKREEAPGREAAPGGGGPGGATDPNSTRDSAPGGDPARDPNPAPGGDPARGGAPGRGSSAEEPRAEELLVEIWGRITAFREGGGEPERLVLSMRNYRLIQNYHARLGLLENNELDYISRYEIFGLPVYVDNEIGLAVQ